MAISGPARNQHDQQERTTSPEEVQRLTGNGAIFRGQVRIADAEYDITIGPPVIEDAAVGPGDDGAMKNITGRLLGSFYDAEALGEGVNTLHLQDGRAFDFRILTPDTNEILGVSWFR